MLAAANSVQVWVYGPDGQLAFASGPAGSGMMSGSGMMGASGSTTPPPQVAAKGMTLRRVRSRLEASPSAQP